MSVPASPVQSHETTATPTPRRKRVLLADDSPEIRESLGKLLHRAGYDVAFAAHGGHVLDRTLGEAVDLLLLDLNMPQMDGWDALAHVASMKPELPIVIITAQPNQQEWVRNSGAHALLEKPLNLPLLLQTIEDFLRQPPGRNGGNVPVPVQRERFRHGWPRRPGAGSGLGKPSGGINE